LAADADAVLDRLVAGQHEVEAALGGIHDHRAGRVIAGEVDGLARNGVSLAGEGRRGGRGVRGGGRGGGRAVGADLLRSVRPRLRLTEQAAEQGLERIGGRSGGTGESKNAQGERQGGVATHGTSPNSERSGDRVKGADAPEAQRWARSAGIRISSD